jgi:hypothetical protein
MVLKYELQLNKNHSGKNNLKNGIKHEARHLNGTRKEKKNPTEDYVIL